MMFTLGCIGAKGNYLLRLPGMAPTEPREYSRSRSGPHGGHLRFSVAQQEVDSRQGARASHRSSGLPHSGRDLLVPGPRTRRGSAASHPHPRPQSRHGARADGSSRLSLFGAGAARAGADSVQATTLTARLGQHRRRTGPHFAPSGSRQDASRCTGLPPQRIFSACLSSVCRRLGNKGGLRFSRRQSESNLVSCHHFSALPAPTIRRETTNWRRRWAFPPYIIAWCVLVAVTAAGVCTSTRLTEAVLRRCARPYWMLSLACPWPLCLLAWGPFDLLRGWVRSAERLVAPPPSRSTCCEELFEGLNTACPGYGSLVGWN
ncbi:hypothetical protein NDU88_007854 [Pleurodeles waltl]|uniref:Uncharacterized protein n=1 Tax=Pleurodeles waltl TaxID=8319 RepID=A0AAV7PMJ3_PLEWA|nr:hypothetical protein NDU88_007854 [Pleurodeles waltl]